MRQTWSHRQLQAKSSDEHTFVNEMSCLKWIKARSFVIQQHSEGCHRKPTKCTRSLGPCSHSVVHMLIRPSDIRTLIREIHTWSDLRSLEVWLVHFFEDGNSVVEGARGEHLTELWVCPVDTPDGSCVCLSIAKSNEQSHVCQCGQC